MQLFTLLTAIALAGPAPVPDRAPDEVKQGKLEDGKIVDLSWASRSSVACFTQMQNRYFNGNVVFYRWTQPVSRDFIIRVTPDAGVDINLYALQLPKTSAGDTPPNVPNVWRCTKGWSNTAGGIEAINVGGYKAEYEIVLGVAGTSGTTSGGFKLEMWNKQGRKW